MWGVLCKQACRVWQLGGHQPADFTVFWLESWFVPPDFGRLDTSALAPHAATVTFCVKVQYIHSDSFSRVILCMCAFPPPSSLGTCSTPITPHGTTIHLAAHPGWRMCTLARTVDLVYTTKTENSSTDRCRRRRSTFCYRAAKCYALTWHHV